MTRDCLPCALRKAEREGLVVARKVTPGFTAGAWGSAKQGDYVAIPAELAATKDFELVTAEDAAAYESREDHEQREDHEAIAASLEPALQE